MYARLDGVKRFIFISSLAAASEEMRLEGSSSAATLADTDDPYAASKLLAEIAMQLFMRESCGTGVLTLFRELKICARQVWGLKF